jgi:hypothetical protein
MNLQRQEIVFDFRLTSNEISSTKRIEGTGRIKRE